MAVERLPVTYAALQECGPGGDVRDRIGPFGEEAPQRGMVPAEVLAGAVAMLADALAEPAHFGDELVAREVVEVGVERRVVHMQEGLPR